ncbi:MAG TPA: hypothetical protein PLP34_05860 [Chitinophagaceae bacterium]|nr:hypothetical protein [Chitinophagaceae bacterium]HNF71916.1 hypothetical protein [Chitinophagaceae bacterium]
MEFRIAPLILAVACLLFLLFMNPEVNSQIPLSLVKGYSTVLLPALLLTILAWGTYRRHTFYSSAFRWSFRALQLLNILLMLYFIYTIRQQHLG